MKNINHKQFNRAEILGIDLGNKGSGNTALCFLLKNKLHFKQTQKGEDEFALILNTIEKYSINLVCIDAPLSLPGAYFDKNKFHDYMYRECDKSCKAMSPMFVGAFTARAIQLKNLLEENNIKVIEVYPKKLVELLNLSSLYPLKKEKTIPSELINKTIEITAFPISKINSMHQYDALLCWLCGYRFSNNQHLEFGNKKEGLIIV